MLVHEATAPTRSLAFSRAVLVLAALIFAAGCAPHSAEVPQTAEPSGSAAVRDDHLVAVIEPHDSCPFHDALRAGMESAAEQLELQLAWHVHPPDDEEAFLQQVRSVAELAPAAVCVQPTFHDAHLVEALGELHQGGTPIVTFHDDLPGAEFVYCYVGTDQFHVGRLLAERLMAEASEGTKIMVASAPSTDRNATTRQRGFAYTLKKEASELTTRQLEAETADQMAAEAVAIADEDSETWIVVTFVPLHTHRLVAALDDPATRPTAQRVQIIGFGAYPGIADDLREGVVRCTLIEDPFLMGKAAIEAVAAAIEGEPAVEIISSGEHPITAEQLDQEGLIELLESNVGPPFPRGLENH